MARLAMAGFETGQTDGGAPGDANGPDGSFSGTDVFAAETTIVRTGKARSLKIACTVTSRLSYVTLSSTPWVATAARDYFASVAVYLGTLPTNEINFFSWSLGGTADNVIIKLASTGVIRMTDGLSAQLGAASSALSTGRWYVIQMKLNVNAAAGVDDVVELKVYDTTTGITTTVQASTTVNATTVLPGALRCGFISAPGNVGATIYLSEIIVNDSTGTNNTTYPDPNELVVYLKPVSDNAIASAQNGASGTTNLWDALDNVPPSGLLTATATSQIKDAAASATENIDFNVQSYASKGLISTDTIKAVRAFANAGPSGSGTAETAAVAIVSNPAATEGTMASGTAAAGNYNTGWTAFPNSSFTEAPTVTLGTQPVLRLGKRTVAGTIMFDQAGIYVGYVPGPRPRVRGVTTGASVAVTSAATR